MDKSINRTNTWNRPAGCVLKMVARTGFEPVRQP